MVHLFLRSTNTRPNAKICSPAGGQINAWDNPDFVKAVEDTKRKDLDHRRYHHQHVPGFSESSVLSAKVIRYLVSLTLRERTRRWHRGKSPWTRLVQAGVFPIDTAAVCSEIQQTWSRPDAAQWAEAYASLFPPYQLLIESHNKAQEVMVKHEVLDSQRDTTAAA